MKDLFNLENPFIHFLGRVGDMILANLLFLICSLPVVTVGASWCAVHKLTQDIVSDQDQGLLKPFFRAFKENFKQATIAWLCILIFLIGMGCNLLLVVSYLTGSTASICKGIVIALTALVLAISGYLFPLIVRYENSLRQHFINATILSVVKLPRTVVILLVNVLPFIILYFSAQTFVRTLVFWLVIGFSFACYITSALLMPIFKNMEEQNTP